jgi:hypothetical protein
VFGEVEGMADVFCCMTGNVVTVIDPLYFVHVSATYTKYGFPSLIWLFRDKRTDWQQVSVAVHSFSNRFKRVSRGFACRDVVWVVFHSKASPSPCFSSLRPIHGGAGGFFIRELMVVRGEGFELTQKTLNREIKKQQQTTGGFFRLLLFRKTTV